jgi:hypothetical protein
MEGKGLFPIKKSPMAFNKRVKIKTILDQNPIGQEITLMFLSSRSTMALSLPITK